MNKVSMMPEQVQFQGMSNFTYYTTTTVTYLLCFAGGLVIDNLGTVFELIAAFSLSFLQFIWPGLFFIQATNLRKEARVWGKEILLPLSYVLMVLGGMVTGLMLTVNIMDIVDESH